MMFVQKHGKYNGKTIESHKYSNNNHFDDSCFLSQIQSFQTIDHFDEASKIQTMDPLLIIWPKCLIRFSLIKQHCLVIQCHFTHVPQLN